MGVLKGCAERRTRWQPGVPCPSLDANDGEFPVPGKTRQLPATYPEVHSALEECFEYNRVCHEYALSHNHVGDTTVYRWLGMVKRLEHLICLDVSNQCDPLLFKQIGDACTSNKKDWVKRQKKKGVPVEDEPAAPSVPSIGPSRPAPSMQAPVAETEAPRKVLHLSGPSTSWLESQCFQPDAPSGILGVGPTTQSSNRLCGISTLYTLAVEIGRAWHWPLLVEWLTGSLPDSRCCKCQRRGRGTRMFLLLVKFKE